MRPCYYGTTHHICCIFRGIKRKGPRVIDVTYSNYLWLSLRLAHRRKRLPFCAPVIRQLRPPHTTPMRQDLVELVPLGEQGIQTGMSGMPRSSNNHHKIEQEVSPIEADEDSADENSLSQSENSGRARALHQIPGCLKRNDNEAAGYGRGWMAFLGGSHRKKG